jgi:formylmethanofuran dehydrogenase subunit D
MKEIIVDVTKYQALQLKRGDSIKVQFGDVILTIRGPKKDDDKKKLY